jgi:hypothetical protein
MTSGTVAELEDEADIELGLDEQALTARAETVTTPTMPASRRTRVRRCVRFMGPECAEPRNLTGDAKLTSR